MPLLSGCVEQTPPGVAQSFATSIGLLRIWPGSVFLPGFHGRRARAHIAFISKLNVRTDDRLVFVVSGIGHRMLNVDDIAELIGAIAWEGREYLLNKKTSLVLPAK